MNLQQKQSQQSLQKVYRKLSFKFPVTLRYGIAIGVIIGLPLCIFAQKPSYFLRTMLYSTFFFGFGTCYSEFWEILQLKYDEIKILKDK